MSDIGPIWLRKELPHPIALAWHLATLDPTPSGTIAAGAVEVALRFVAGLQAANLLSRGAPLPSMLVGGGFKRPTLGSWIALVRDLRRTLRAPFPDELASWPDPPTEQRLDALVRLRNRLAHPGQMTPMARRGLDREIAACCAEILESLGWLRALELVSFVDAQPGPSEVVGRLQIFRGTEPHPGTERVAWRGHVALHRLYVGAPDAALLLDVEPFMRRARLKGARVEALCLWKGMGERGDVLLFDDGQDAFDWVPIEGGERRIVAPRRALGAGSEGVTRHEQATKRRPVDSPSEAPTLIASPLPPRRSSSPSSRRWWLVAGVLMVVVALVGFALASRQDDAIDSTAGGVAPIRAEGGECLRPALAGDWTFETHILKIRPGQEEGYGTRGHYRLSLEHAVGCRMSAYLTKDRWTTQSGRSYEAAMSQDLSFAISSTGRSITARARLVKRPGDRNSADISLRLARHGAWLVGLWRHDGADWDRASASGALVGRQASSARDPRPACFMRCAAECHPGLDPLDPAMEPCLIDCARRLDDCSE